MYAPDPLTEELLKDDEIDYGDRAVGSRWACRWHDKFGGRRANRLQPNRVHSDSAARGDHSGQRQRWRHDHVQLSRHDDPDDGGSRHHSGWGRPRRRGPKHHAANTATNFTGCSTSDNGIDAPAIGHLRGRNSTVRNLTFRYFLESLQIIGPDNVVEGNVFLGHNCSDDAVSTTTVQARNATIRNNRFQDYRDKAYQMSYGSGTIEGNTFTNTVQPIRGPYDNSQGGLFVIRSNVFTTTGNRESCTGVTIDGTYQLVFERNTMECFRGLRLGGSTQAIVRDNIIDGNPRQGVLIGDSAVVSLSGNTITNNGLSPGSEPGGGGGGRWSGRLAKRASRSWWWLTHHRRTAGDEPREQPTSG